MLRKAEALALCRAEHGDPFAVLGMHRAGRRLVGPLRRRPAVAGNDDLADITLFDGLDEP